MLDPTYPVAGVQDGGAESPGNGRRLHGSFDCLLLQLLRLLGDQAGAGAGAGAGGGAGALSLPFLGPSTAFP